MQFTHVKRIKQSLSTCGGSASASPPDFGRTNLGRTDGAGGTANAVIDLIRESRLVPGDNLPSENALAQRLGVGRGTVREAFKTLEALGVLELSPGRRAQVGTLKSSMLATLVDHAVATMQVGVQQTYDVRRTLEMRTARLAALHRSEAELQAIREAAWAMRQRGDGPEAPTEEDVAFHAAVARASQNPFYAFLIEGFSQVIRHTSPISWAARQTGSLRQASHDLHDAVAEAVARKDPAAAEAAMAAHFDNSVKALIAAGMT